MLQLLYISSAARRAGAAELDAIYHQARRNNAGSGVTGLLYSDGKRFLQALEGAEDAVEATYARIVADPRHRAVVLLSRRTIEEREFGPWSMARPSDLPSHETFATRIAELCANADPMVKGTFAGLVEARRAA